MNNQPKIFVIVVTYKGMRWYDKCFTSLRESTMPVQTIVVDNTPGDEDANYIREHFPEIILLKPEQNLGFGKGNNEGLKYARKNDCDFVFLLNQDAWVESDTIENLLKVYKEYPEYGVLSPMHILPDTGDMGMLLDDGNLNLRILNGYYKNQLLDVYPVRYVNAAAWFMTRKTIEEIGGFCPLIFHYGEDDDYINRLHYHHISIGLCPKQKVYHDSGKPLPDREVFRAKAQEEGASIFLDINKPIKIDREVCCFFKKWIMAILKRRRHDSVCFKKKLLFLCKNYTELKFCRKQHIVKQANWINE